MNQLQPFRIKYEILQVNDVLWHAYFICCASDMHVYEGVCVTEQGDCSALQRLDMLQE